MPPHHDPDDEGPVGDDPLPPEDRLWRHPSELAAGVGPPAAWFAPPRPTAADTRRSLLLGAVAGACLAGVLVAAGAMWLTRPTRTVQESPTSTAAVTTKATYSFAPIPTERLAEQFNPSVPSVRVLKDGTWQAGSGVWIDDRGTVLTATPLVAGAASILVTGIDGKARKAQVTGADPATGITVLDVGRTSGKALVVAATVARSGEAIAIVSSPQAMAGRESTSSAISLALVRMASMRNAVGTTVVHDSLQIDRPIPTDAIGGLIVDAEGRPVGIALGSTSDRSMGVASPAGDAVAAAEDLRDDGRVQRAWLGVRAVDLEPGAATMLHLAGGAQLTVVTPGSPADEAGLRVGDVVTAVDNAPVGDASDLVLALRNLDPGDVTTIAVRRDGRADDLVVRLGG